MLKYRINLKLTFLTLPFRVNYSILKACTVIEDVHFVKQPPGQLKDREGPSLYGALVQVSKKSICILERFSD